MTKNEFMSRLNEELRRRNVADAADVAEEYEQHFAFKLADGYAEEIAARLGDPAALVAQFEGAPRSDAALPAVLTRLWLAWVDLFFGVFAALLLSFGAVLAACVLGFGLTGFCLIAGFGRLPFVPYGCGVLLGLSLLLLCALTVVGCIWFLRSCGSCFAPMAASATITLPRAAAARGFCGFRSRRSFPPRPDAVCALPRWSL